MPVLDITMSGPIFMSRVPPPRISPPRISPLPLADGLGEGMGIFICEWSGVACGFGEDDGIDIPGMFMSILGDAPGDGDGMGMFMSIVCWGEACGFGEAVGRAMPGIFI
jgi:hypothetical protein